MTTIILVRHAATAWTGVRYSGQIDPPLSFDGIRAAEVMAAHLAPALPPGVRIVTSPSRRARETATILARMAAPAVLETDARWMEARFGEAEGATFDEIDARSPALAARLAAGEVEIDWPGGETAAALRHRVERAWGEIVATGRPTVVISHAGPIRLAVALATGVDAAGASHPGPAEAVRLDVGVAGRPAVASRVGP